MVWRFAATQPLNRCPVPIFRPLTFPACSPDACAAMSSSASVSYAYKTDRFEGMSRRRCFAITSPTSCRVLSEVKPRARLNNVSISSVLPAISSNAVLVLVSPEATAASVIARKRVASTLGESRGAISVWTRANVSTTRGSVHCSLGALRESREPRCPKGVVDKVGPMSGRRNSRQQTGFARRLESQFLTMPSGYPVHSSSHDDAERSARPDMESRSPTRCQRRRSREASFSRTQLASVVLAC